MTGRLAAGLLLAGGLSCAQEPPALMAGDLIFHTSKSRQSEALQLATNSPYSHMGVVFLRDGEPTVLEAVGPVRYTPFDEWVERGLDGRYVVKRLRDSQDLLTPEAIGSLQSAGERYMGAPYDIYFEWSDDRIYCSELAWKAYKEVLNLEIGSLETFGEFDLSNPLVQAGLKERFGDDIPLDEPVISPRAMFESPLLETVTER